MSELVQRIGEVQSPRSRYFSFFIIIDEVSPQYSYFTQLGGFYESSQGRQFGFSF